MNQLMRFGFLPIVPVAAFPYFCGMRTYDSFGYIWLTGQQTLDDDFLALMILLYAAGLYLLVQVALMMLTGSARLKAWHWFAAIYAISWMNLVFEAYVLSAGLDAGPIAPSVVEWFVATSVILPSFLVYSAWDSHYLYKVRSE